MGVCESNQETMLDPDEGDEGVDGDQVMVRTVSVRVGVWVCVRAIKRPCPTPTKATKATMATR